MKILAGAIATDLGSLLRKECPVVCSAMREDSAEALFDKEINPAYSLALDKDSPPILIQVEGSIAQAWVDGLLGGEGTPREIDRPPTTIESILIGGLIRDMGRTIQRHSGSDDTVAEPVSTLIEKEDRDELRARSGILTIFTIQASEEENGVIRILFGFDELARRLGLGTSRAGSVKSEDTIDVEQLAEVMIHVSAHYPHITVPIRDLTGLEVGDILYLDRKWNEEVEVHVAGKLAYFGHPGCIDQSLGIRISRTGS